MPEFREWPSIPRLNREMIVTEKIDGTNGCVIVSDEGVFAQSRSRVLIEDDPFGFNSWVKQNADILAEVLGLGYHYGEWWGQKIQRKYGLDHRRFSLFNVNRYSKLDLSSVENLYTVPVLYTGLFSTEKVKELIDELTKHGSYAAPGFMNPEGVVVYHTAANMVFKATVKNDEKPKSLVNK